MGCDGIRLIDSIDKRREREDRVLVFPEDNRREGEEMEDGYGRMN